ncbi:MAG TPA: MFS transporter [Terriglobia bacterium]|nr:MFS transporter [Terriglobia bacterium]
MAFCPPARYPDGKLKRSLMAFDTSVTSATATRYSAPTDEPSTRLQAGTPAFRRTARAMFVGGFATFALLYGMQPLMPMFSVEFNLMPAAASGVISAATGAMAVALIPASLLADRFGRKIVMNAALALAALLTLAAAMAGSFQQLVILRGLMGLALAGLPAVAMAYLSEEIDPQSLGRSMGLYIAGNGLGGLSGRLLLAVLTEWTSWRVAVTTLGVLGLVAAIEFSRSLPASRHFRPIELSLRELWSDAKAHFSDGGLPWLFLTGFLLMGCFVSVYNYLGYRLAESPFDLSPSQIGLVFTLYLVGMVGSAWGGKLADRIGRRNVLWMMVAVMAVGLLLTLAPSLVVIVLGVACLTFGFFGGHSVASSWIGRRALRARALASAIYLCCYYLGSSGIGSTSGLMWSFDGWNGVVALLAVVMLVLAAVSLRLRRLAPLPVNLGKP